ncbi:F-box protein PP2-B10-like [Durio zibethinus]|uniref:F-box protein PP2-B10-like n=1 Tax=Durio zibethinus TaxID=66656 RepID=A0A6P5WQX0_DURZI|nr:F-box protein PP2-B10-like [Durio zibethinus]
MESEFSEMAGGGREVTIPQDCVESILSRTSPQDACSLSLVSTTFKSAAESDAVWESFLPPGYEVLIPSSLCFSTKKELYRRLCERPVLIDGGRKSFSLERGSGKKCYMLSARDLFIVWSDTPTYWRWVSIPESRFEEVAELISVCRLEIRGNITLSMLSPMTRYKAYLVFKKTTGAYGFDIHPVEVSVGLVGNEGSMKTAYLDAERGGRQRYQIVPRRRIGRGFNRSRFFGLHSSVPTSPSDDQYPKVRVDGWLEIELGEFFNEGGVDGELEMSVLEVKFGRWKGGLLIQGIEIRPDPCVSDSSQ